jgi:hypothetical protein
MGFRYSLGYLLMIPPPGLSLGSGSVNMGLRLELS